MADLPYDELLDAVRGRVERFAAVGDAEDVLDPAGVRDASVLATAAPRPNSRLRVGAHRRWRDVQEAIALLHYARHLAGRRAGRAGNAGTDAGSGNASDPDADLATAQGIIGELGGGNSDLSARRAALEEAARRPDDPSVYAAPVFFSGASLRDIDSAIMSTRRAMRRLPPQERPGYRMHVASMQLDRAGRTGDLADIDAALGTVREVLSDTPRDHPHFAGRISMVSQGMQLRYTLSGDPADLTRAVDAARTAADATAAGHEDRAMYLSNFGRALLFRYQSTLDVSDLAEARVVLLTAVAATTDDEPNRGTRYNALAHAHLETYQQTGDDGELDSGVRLAERAVAAATVVGDDNRFQWTVDLCTALLLRHSVRGDPDDERRGVALAREMADALPGDHPLGAYARHIIAAADRPSEDQR